MRRAISAALSKLELGLVAAGGGVGLGETARVDWAGAGVGRGDNDRSAGVLLGSRLAGAGTTRTGTGASAARKTCVNIYEVGADVELHSRRGEVGMGLGAWGALSKAP